MNARIAVISMCLWLASHAVAFAETGSAVETDRPDVRNSTKTVPPGAFQIEAGLDYARSSRAASPAERRLGVQATFRVGLTDQLEGRLEGEPLVRLRGDEEETGPGDPTLALKYRFVNAQEGRWWPSLGVQPYVKLPVADAPIGSERPDFGVVALVSFQGRGS